MRVRARVSVRVHACACVCACVCAFVCVCGCVVVRVYVWVRVCAKLHRPCYCLDQVVPVDPPQCLDLVPSATLIGDWTFAATRAEVDARTDMQRRLVALTREVAALRRLITWASALVIAVGVFQRLRR